MEQKYSTTMKRRWSVKVGDLVRHNHFGYIGILVKRDGAKWIVLRYGDLRGWWPENIEVINESR